MSNCNNSVRVLILTAVVLVFLMMGFVEAGYKVPYEPYPVGYPHGGYATGPNEYGKIVGWFLPPKKKACSLPFFLAKPICSLHCFSLGKSGGYCKHAFCWCTIH